MIDLSRLLGTWVLEWTSNSLWEGSVSLQFTQRGLLLYSRSSRSRESHAFLRFRVEGGTLTTIDRERGIEHRMDAAMPAANLLVVRDEGHEFRYARKPAQRSFEASSELLDLLVFTVDQGVARIKDAPRLKPFLVSEGSGERAVIGFDHAQRNEGVAEARRTIVLAGSRLSRAVVCYDGVLTLGKRKRLDAIFVEAYERGQTDGAIFAQRYLSKRLLRPFRLDGQLEFCGRAEGLI